MEGKSFEEYFKGFECYDEGGELDQGILEDAKKVFEKLKTPKAIKEFHDADYKKQEELVGPLRDHSALSFSLVCKNAYDYAQYMEKFTLRDKHPDIVKAMANAKDEKGNAVFSDAEIDDFFFNCGKTIEKHPERITTVLDNPEEIKMILSYKNRAAGLWRSTEDPLDSTVKKNPEAFKNSEIEAEIAALRKKINGRL